MNNIESAFFNNPLKDVDCRVFTRMLRTEGSVTISLCNFVGEGIIRAYNSYNHVDFQGHRTKVKVTGSNFYLVNTRINILQWILVKLGTCLVFKRIWNPVDFQGQRSRFPGQIWRVCKLSVHLQNIWMWPKRKQGQRKAWCISSPKNLTQWPIMNSKAQGDPILTKHIVTMQY
jgi:hypothetical protein